MKALDNIQYPSLTNLERSDDERQHDQNFQTRLNKNFKSITDAITELESSIARVPTIVAGMLPEQPADYIVEQGTAGNWKYVKYESGMCEAWRETLELTVNVDNATGSMYRADAQSVALPDGLFQTVETANVTLRTTSHSYAAAVRAVYSASISIEIFGSASASISAYINLILKGTWK